MLKRSILFAILLTGCSMPLGPVISACTPGVSTEVRPNCTPTRDAPYDCLGKVWVKIDCKLSV